MWYLLIPRPGYFRQKKLLQAAPEAKDIVNSSAKRWLKAYTIGFPWYMSALLFLVLLIVTAIPGFLFGLLHQISLFFIEKWIAEYQESSKLVVSLRGSSDKQWEMFFSKLSPESTERLQKEFPSVLQMQEEERKEHEQERVEFELYAQQGH